MGSSSQNDRGSSDVPPAIWGVVDLISRELQATKDELQAANEKLKLYWPLEEENRLLREEVKLLRAEMDAILTKHLKEFETEGDTVTECALGVCRSADENTRLKGELEDLQRQYSIANEKLVAEVTKLGMLTDLCKSSKNRETFQTQACDVSMDSRALRHTEPVAITKIPQTNINATEHPILRISAPDSTECQMQLQETRTDEQVRIYPIPRPKTLLPRVVSTEAVRTTDAGSSGRAKPLSTHGFHPSLRNVSGIMKPQHIMLLPSTDSELQDPTMLMRPSLRVECDAYPALFCHANVVWCFGSTSHDALVVLPISFYEPHASPDKCWSENTALTAPMAQTWEVIYREDSEHVFYAGTYECQLSDTPVHLTYTQLSDSVRRSICRDTLHPTWRCRVSGGSQRENIMTTIERNYFSGKVAIAGLRLKHVGFNQKLLQRLLVELSANQTGIVKLNSEPQPPPIPPPPESDKALPAIRGRGRSRKDSNTRAAKRARGLSPSNSSMWRCSQS